MIRLNTVRRNRLFGQALLCLAACLAIGVRAAVSPKNLPVLTSVEQVRQLTPEETKRNYPVKLRAVVTYYDGHDFFIQDSTAGIYLIAAKTNLNIRPGQLVEVAGVSDPGLFAPVIKEAQAEILGIGQIPIPRANSFEHLMTGQEDSQWVQLRGVVRIAKVSDGHLSLEIAATGGRFNATIPGFADKAAPAGLLDAVVRVRGACGTIFTQKRQLVGIKLFTPSLDEITIEESGPADPFMLPVQKINSLLQFNPKAASQHRVRVQGVVTHQRRGTTLFIQDETGALRLNQVEKTNSFKIGESVDVVGFPAPGPLSVMLQDATARKAGSGVRPSPVKAAARDLQAGEYDSALVLTEALLIDQVAGSFDHTLVMQSGRFIFNAQLENSKAGKNLQALRPGSRLQLTGVCLVQLDESQQPRSFRLLLDSPADVRVLASPTWWTLNHALTVLGLMAVVVLAALAWVILLRRRVREQTEQISQRLERESALEQRFGQLVENASDIVFAQDLAGNFTSINKAAEKITGYSSSEALGLNLTQVVAPQDLDAVQQMIRCQFAEQLPATFELEIIAKDGRTVLLEICPRLITQGGKVVGVEGIARDITERKRAEEALRRSEVIFKLISDNISDLIAVVDSEGKRLYNSPSYGRILGAAPGLAGTDSFEQIHPEDRDRVKNVFLETIRTEVGQRMEYRFLLPDGSVRHIESQGNYVRGEAGQPGKVVVISRDITERKHAEAALQFSEELNRRILESVPGGIVYADRTGKVLRANAVALKVLGVTSEALGSLTIAQIEGRLFHEDGRELEPQDFPVSKCLSSGAPQAPVTLGFQRFDGGVSWGIFTSLPLKGPQPHAASPDQIGASVVMTFVDLTERKQAEAALRQSHERFELVVQGANDGFWDWNMETEEIYFSPRYKSMLGYADHEIKNRFEEWERLLHPEDRAQANQMVKTCFDPQVSHFEFEQRLLHKDGTYRWILARGTVLRRKNGQPYRMAGLLIDLTERKHAEQILRETEELYRRAIAAADSVAYRRDYQTNSFTFIGKEISKMTGYSAQEMTPRKWESLVKQTIMRGEAAGLTEEEAIRRFRSGEMTFWRDDCRILTRDGETRWIADTSLEIRNAQGENFASIGILQDITERKRAEEAVRKSEELFSKAFRASPIPISISTEEGRYVDVNESFLRLMGFSREEIIGRTSLELGIWEKPEDRAQLLQQLRDRRALRDTELKLRAKSGQTCHVLASFELIELEAEMCILSMLHDMTERQNLEAQLRQSQKMESIGQLAGGIAHDFNNILTIIQGHVSLLLDGGQLAPKLAGSARLIFQASERAANLTRQLLAFGRRQFLQPANLDLNEVVGKMSQMLQRVLGEDIALLVNPAQHLPFVHADAGMMDQVLLNLAINSRDAMPKGGRLTISTEVTTIDEDYVRLNPESAAGQFVRLTFSDTGGGIAPENLTHLFEPFFTTKDVGKGTGLGLATVYGIVKQHQGWIKVASEVGRGTTFQIFLPRCSTPPAQIVVMPGDDKPVRGGTETILVVEDEATVRNLVLKFLDRLGYKALEARSGVTALDVWRTHQHDIALLLTDMVMPDGMSGRELAQTLRAEKPQLKVVYTSGYSAEAVGKDVGLRDGRNFLQKPYHPRKLAEIIRDALDRTRT